MRILFTFIIAFTGFAQCFGQNNTLRGIVKLQSSGSKPLADVQISAFGAGSVYANSSGMFELIFNGKKPGGSVSLLVQKDGYELINDKELENCVLRENPDELVQVVMARQGERNKQALAYYNIITGNANNNYKQQLDNIHTRLSALDEDDESRQVLRAQIDVLQEEKEALLNRAEELAKQMASVDLDGASKIARSAYEKFKNGDIKAALIVLDDKTLDENYRDAQQEKVKLRERLIQADSAHAQSIENYMIKARFCTSDRQYEEAFNNFKKAIEADSTNVKNLTEVGDYCNHLNQQIRAIRFYDLALKNANSPSQQAQLLVKLGNQYSYDNNFPKTGELYQQSLELTRQLVKEHPGLYEKNLAEVHRVIGRMNFELNDQVKAEESYMKSLRILEGMNKNSPGNYEEDLAVIQNYVGNLFSKQKEYSKAEEAFEKALTAYQHLAVKYPGKYELDLAETYWGVAILQARMAAFDKAEEAFLKSIETFKKLAAENPQRHEPSLASVEMGLAVMYYHAENYPQSKSGYAKAIQIYERLAEENPRRYEPSLSKTLLNLGSLYSTLEDYENAEENYAKSLQIRKRLAKENPQRFDVAYCHTLLNIAYMKKRIFYQKYDMNQRPEALALISEAEEILSRYDTNLPWVQAYSRDAVMFKTYFINVTKEDLKVQTEIDKIIPLEDKIQASDDLTEILNAQKLLIETLEKVLPEYPTNKRLISRIAEAYGSLASFQLSDQQFPDAEKSAMTGLDLDPSQEWINSYLGLALTFQGKSKSALKLYAKLKDHTYEGEPLKAIFLGDLEALEKEGIQHVDNLKIRELLEK